MEQVETRTKPSTKRLQRRRDELIKRFHFYFERRHDPRGDLRMRKTFDQLTTVIRQLVVLRTPEEQLNHNVR